jgi:hypothetical protein
MGEKYHPLPWETLRYNEQQGSYVVDLDKSRLEGAPSYDSDFKWTPNYGREVDSYYNVRR